MHLPTSSCQAVFDRLAFMLTWVLHRYTFRFTTWGWIAVELIDGMVSVSVMRPSCLKRQRIQTSCLNREIPRLCSFSFVCVCR